MSLFHDIRHAFVICRGLLHKFDLSKSAESNKVQQQKDSKHLISNVTGELCKKTAVKYES